MDLTDPVVRFIDVVAVMLTSPLYTESQVAARKPLETASPPTPEQRTTPAASSSNGA
jgi:hypothetical protein